MSREERLSRANEILNSNDLKQAICHQILGTTFKDIERAMTAIISERQLTEEQADKLDLEKLAPEKFNPEIVFKVNKQASNNSKEPSYRTYTREEVSELLAQTDAPFNRYVPAEKTQYPTMPRYLAEQLVREHFEYKEMERKKKEERKSWDTKTTESEVKTAIKTKRSKSTKT